MWSDAEKFSGAKVKGRFQWLCNKLIAYFVRILALFTESGRYAVFCLIRVCGEVQDTELVCMDKTTTDLIFRDVLVLWVWFCFYIYKDVKSELRYFDFILHDWKYISVHHRLQIRVIGSRSFWVMRSNNMILNLFLSMNVGCRYNLVILCPYGGISYRTKLINLYWIVLVRTHHTTSEWILKFMHFLCLEILFRHQRLKNFFQNWTDQLGNQKEKEYVIVW